MTKKEFNNLFKYEESVITVYTSAEGKKMWEQRLKEHIDYLTRKHGLKIKPNNSRKH